jgi:hypothetical protein
MGATHGESWARNGKVYDKQVETKSESSKKGKKR